MNYSEILKTIHNEIGGVLSQISSSQADALLEAILEAKRIYITGEGRSGLVAKTFAMRLQHLGLVSYVVGETICPATEAGDLLIAVSGSGKSAGTLVVAEGAKKAGAKLAAISATAENPLTKISDLILIVPGATKHEAAGEAKSIQPLSSLFDQSQHIVQDALTVLLGKRLEKTKEEMKSKHSNV
jgi:6-phospho-3-hexuloisomerase